MIFRRVFHFLGLLPSPWQNFVAAILWPHFLRKPEGSSFLVEIKLGGHCSFTSCELYNPAYGNGIGESKSLSKPGETYQALDIVKQHEIINTYALAFLDKYLRGGDDALLKENKFEEHMIYRT